MLKYDCPHKRETIKLESIGDVTVSELTMGDIESFHKNKEINDEDIIRLVKKYSNVGDKFNDLVSSEIGYLYDRIIVVTFGEAKEEDGGKEDEKK